MTLLAHSQTVYNHQLTFLSPLQPSKLQSQSPTQPHSYPLRILAPPAGPLPATFPQLHLAHPVTFCSPSQEKAVLHSPLPDAPQPREQQQALSFRVYFGGASPVRGRRLRPPSTARPAPPLRMAARVLTPPVALVVCAVALLALLGPADARSSPSRKSRRARAIPYWPAGTKGELLTFEKIEALTDEFDSKDHSKWSYYGDLNEATGCPLWTGPAPLYLDPSGRLNRVWKGKLELFLEPAGKSYFKNREYYCVRDKAKGNYGYCNWDKTRSGEKCGRGDRRYEDWRCKKAPYCFDPGQKTYHSLVAGQVLAKTEMKYGYVETRLLASRPESNTVSAAWLSRQFWDPPYSRTNPDTGKWEGNSPIRQRHWQEIDIAELMMSPVMGGDKFVPNVHMFAGYDGRYTAKDGEGPGPIIQDRSIAGKVHNEMHWDPGPQYTHHETWRDGWNTFAVWWDEDEIRWIVNGVERSRYKNRYIHQPQLFKFNLLTDLKWFGQLPKSAEVFQVDYIRSWNVKKSDAVTKDPTVIPGTLQMDDSMGAAKPPPIIWPKPGHIQQVLSRQANASQISG